MKDYLPAKQHIAVSPGESVRIIRELQELSQNQLAELTGILVFPGWKLDASTAA